MKHLIITGAYGLVGSNFTFPSDWKITRIKFNEIPDCEPADYIIHAAGYGQPSKFTNDKIATIAVNTTTTIELFKKLKKDGTFLFVSTSEVYSGATPPYKETDIGTTTPEHPRACYIEAKRCGEAICHAYQEQGYNVKIARLGLGYGAGTKKGDGRVLHQFIERALEDYNVFSCMGDGSATRNYIYIKDATYLMFKILTEGKQTVYNVGGIEKVSIKGLGQMIAELTGKIFVTTPDNRSIKEAPQDVQLAMWNTLGEFPIAFTPLFEGLKETIKWQKSL